MGATRIKAECFRLRPIRSKTDLKYLSRSTIKLSKSISLDLLHACRPVTRKYWRLHHPRPCSVEPWCTRTAAKNSALFS